MRLYNTGRFVHINENKRTNRGKYVLDETHFSRTALKGLQSHYDAHVATSMEKYEERQKDASNPNKLFKPMSIDEYDNAADELSRTKACNTMDTNNGNRIVGYKEINTGRIIKYDKKKKELVCYIAEPNDKQTISYYKLQDDNAYNEKRRLSSLHSYLRGINDPEDDKYNKPEIQSKDRK